MQRVMKYATLLTFHLHAVRGWKHTHLHRGWWLGCTVGGGESFPALCVGKIYARIAPNAAVDIDHPKIGKYLTALQFAFAILLAGERVLQKDQEEQTTGYRLSRCL